MDYQMYSCGTSGTDSLSDYLRPQATTKTVAQILEDTEALKDWVANIEKIRHLEADEAAKKMAHA